MRSLPPLPGDHAPGLLHEPTLADWTAAAAALRAGDGEPMAEVLRALDLPIALVETFAVVLQEAATLQTAIDNDTTEDPARLDAAVGQLRRTRATTVEEALSITDAIADLERKAQDCRNRRGVADSARQWLGGLHVYFPELFGISQPAAKLHAMMGTTSYNAAIRLGLDPFMQTWRDYCRPAAAIIKPKRKIRAAGR